MSRSALAVLGTALACALGSCAAPQSPGSGPAAATVMLSVTVTGVKTPRAATLQCAATNYGTGYLSSADAATAACKTVLDQANATLLVDGPPKDRVCSEIYGGDEVGTVVGTIRRDKVSATFKRSDGCGIADWDRLSGLLGPPDSGPSPATPSPS